jgi:hypothetical protein
MTDGIYEKPEDLCLVCGSTYKTDRADHIKEGRAECKQMAREERIKQMPKRFVEPEWHTSEDVCPKCKEATQSKYEVDEEDHVVITAERCLPCSWQVDFD